VRRLALLGYGVYLRGQADQYNYTKAVIDKNTMIIRIKCFEFV